MHFSNLPSFPGRVDSKNNTADRQLRSIKNHSAWERGYVYRIADKFYFWGTKFSRIAQTIFDTTLINQINPTVNNDF